MSSSRGSTPLAHAPFRRHPDPRTARFRDCRHLEEPECGVKAAVADGTLARVRYETYLRTLESL